MALTSVQMEILDSAIDSNIKILQSLGHKLLIDSLNEVLQTESYAEYAAGLKYKVATSKKKGSKITPEIEKSLSALAKLLFEPQSVGDVYTQLLTDITEPLEQNEIVEHVGKAILYQMIMIRFVPEDHDNVISRQSLNHKRANIVQGVASIMFGKVELDVSNRSFRGLSSVKEDEGLPSVREEEETSDCESNATKICKLVTTDDNNYAQFRVSVYDFLEDTAAEDMKMEKPEDRGFTVKQINWKSASDDSDSDSEWSEFDRISLSQPSLATSETTSSSNYGSAALEQSGTASSSAYASVSTREDKQFESETITYDLPHDPDNEKFRYSRLLTDQTEGLDLAASSSAALFSPRGNNAAELDKRKAKSKALGKKPSVVDSKKKGGFKLTAPGSPALLMRRLKKKKTIKPTRTIDILVLGDSGAGKTSIIRKFIEGMFSFRKENSDKIVSHSVIRMIDNECVRLNIHDAPVISTSAFDTDEQKLEKTIEKAKIYDLYEKVNHILLAVDGTNLSNVDELEKLWLNAMPKGKKPTIIVNKKDLIADDNPDFIKIRKKLLNLTDKYKLRQPKFASAMTGMCIETTFQSIVYQAMKTEKAGPAPTGLLKSKSLHAVSRKVRGSNDQSLKM